MFNVFIGIETSCLDCQIRCKWPKGEREVQIQMYLVDAGLARYRSLLELSSGMQKLLENATVACRYKSNL